MTICENVCQWMIDSANGNTVALQHPFPDWQQLGHPGYTGFMRYRCEFTWPPPAGSALLSLGELRYAATVFLDEDKAGDCIFSPFTLRLDNLTTGRHTLEIDVLNTPANAVYGDKERLQSLRRARAFEGTYAPLYEPLDMTKLRSGLFGPVTLHRLEDTGEQC